MSRVDFKKIKGKKILVTGANGFLGQYILGALSLANRQKKLGCKIVAVSLSSPNPVIRALLKLDKKLSYKRVDLTKNFNLFGFDYIFHAAGFAQPAKFVQNPAAVVAVNVNATQNLLAANKHATFVFFSSAEVYGNIPPKLLPVSENFNGNSPLHEPRSVYAGSKRLGEALCAAYKRMYGANVKIVRISHVYGPGLPFGDRRVMSEFISQALTKKEISLLDAGQSLKTYGYVADVAAMILFAAFCGNQTVYNVGGKDSLTILNLAKKIAKICRVNWRVPAKLAKSAHIGRDPLVVKLKLTKILGEMKNFKFTNLSHGLENTVEWHKNLTSKVN